MLAYSRSFLNIVSSYSRKHVAVARRRGSGTAVQYLAGEVVTCSHCRLCIAQERLEGSCQDRAISTLWSVFVPPLCDLKKPNWMASQVADGAAAGIFGGESKNDIGFGTSRTVIEGRVAVVICHCAMVVIPLSIMVQSKRFWNKKKKQVLRQRMITRG